MRATQSAQIGGVLWNPGLGIALWRLLGSGLLSGSPLAFFGLATAIVPALIAFRLLSMGVRQYNRAALAARTPIDTL